jgi:hypothetical protein
MWPDKRTPKPTRRDDVDSEPRQQRNRGGVKGIPGRNPDSRLDSFFLETLHSAPQLLFLLGCRERSELAFLSSGYQTAILSHIEMLIAVQRNRPTKLLPSPNALPKIVHPGIDLEHGIAVVRHNSQNRFDAIVD